MRNLVGMLWACVSLCSCGPEPAQRSLLFEEGKGIAGICHLGEEGRAFRRKFAISRVETTFSERGVGRVRAYAAGNLVFETIDRGEGERLARISLLCSSTNKPTGQVRTTLGLELLPTPPTREQVVAIYGKAVREYDSDQDFGMVQDIKDGVAYVVVEKPDFPEFLHYPANGISFVLHKGKVIKCSLQQPRFRPLWGY